MATRPIRAKYSHAIADARKIRKYQEARKRQVVRNTRNNVEQLAKLNAGNFKATKERARLRNN